MLISIEVMLRATSDTRCTVPGPIHKLRPSIYPTTDSRALKQLHAFTKARVHPDNSKENDISTLLDVNPL